MGDLWGRVRKKGVLSLGENIGPEEIRLKIPGMNPIGVCRGQGSIKESILQAMSCLRRYVLELLHRWPIG